MSGDIKNHKEEVEKLNRLVEKYAQSRSLGLWVAVVVLLINTFVVIGSIELMVVLTCRRSSWWLAPIVPAVL